ncbi:protein TPX2-like isoform X1 [Musa acuminata AAA Group]|uniref:protein TPX2-like isoform X1 n=1 Tax=Musa acuminata AAA Group TaxID=214697 RepID=UPI0031E150D3
MDHEMAEATDEVFVCFEVDLDYEFDAPRYFDLGREETPAEARAAELWFDTAGTYPPSPLIAKLIFQKDTNVANTSTAPNLEDLVYTNPEAAHADAAAPGFSIVQEMEKGCTFHSSILQGVSKGDHISTVNNCFSKRSTLMKPTASQLAKKKWPREVKSISRLQKPLEVKREQRFEDSNDYIHQAAKRQRLEKGHCCKVTDAKQQINLFHKVPEKKNGLSDANNQLPRLRLTIPREPELETARRAFSFRAQRQRLVDAKCLVEGMPQFTSTFKAHPLNRKILEAPSLPLPQKSTPRLPKFKEFNFRTHSRALLHSTTSSTLTSGSHIPTTTGDVKSSVRAQFQTSGHQLQQNECKRDAEVKDISTKFRPQALNQKILANKGDIGVFRSTKRDTTIPKEFNFLTTKRFQQNPLNELFNKLSLASEAQKATAQRKFPLPSHLDAKVSNLYFSLFNLIVFPSNCAF